MRFANSILKTLAVTVALLFLLGAMLTAVTELFGGSKVRPLFGMSAEALAAGPVDAGRAPNAQNAAPNAPNAEPLEPTRFSATKAAPLPLPRRAKDGGAPPTYFPASKSAPVFPGGEGLPGLDDAAPQQASPQQAAPPQPQKKP